MHSNPLHIFNLFKLAFRMDRENYSSAQMFHHVQFSEYKNNKSTGFGKSLQIYVIDIMGCT